MPYQHDSITPYSNQTLSKKQQVALMFNNIATTYDQLNRILSFRIDILWRKAVIKTIRPLAHKSILDVATGTGDLAITIAQHLPQASIIGIDIATKMLAIADHKIQHLQLETRIRNEVQDAEQLSFANNTFDIISVAFGIRNFEHLNKGLQEMHRVLKTNGSLVILEFSTPQNPIVRFFYGLYRLLFIKFIGRLFSKDNKAYDYLNKSSVAFPTPQVLQSILLSQGFRKVNIRSLSLGICTMYIAQK